MTIDNIKTDLAIENREMLISESEDKEVEISGVVVEQDSYGDINVTRIEIADDEGSQKMGKPKGNYITIELPKLAEVLEEPTEIKDAVSKVLAMELKKIAPVYPGTRVLVVGLGNRSITPDALGPETVSKVKATRGYLLNFDTENVHGLSTVSCIVPGVMGSTGIESAEYIETIAKHIDTDIIIAIDSLAARNFERITTTIQMSDSGISPGAGTGNHRKELNTESMNGIKVIAIGVPTVIDSKTLILDSLSGFLEDEKEAEKYIEEIGLSMIVTASEIDQVIEDFSDIISNGINNALNPSIYS